MPPKSANSVGVVGALHVDCETQSRLGKQLTVVPETPSPVAHKLFCVSLYRRTQGVWSVSSMTTASRVRRIRRDIHRDRARRNLHLETLEDRRVMAVMIDTFDDVVADDGYTSLREAISLVSNDGVSDSIVLPHDDRGSRRNVCVVAWRVGHRRRRCI